MVRVAYSGFLSRKAVTPTVAATWPYPSMIFLAVVPTKKTIASGDVRCQVPDSGKSDMYQCQRRRLDSTAYSI